MPDKTVMDDVMVAARRTERFWKQQTDQQRTAALARVTNTLASACLRRKYDEAREALIEIAALAINWLEVVNGSDKGNSAAQTAAVRSGEG